MDLVNWWVHVHGTEKLNFWANNPINGTQRIEIFIGICSDLHIAYSFPVKNDFSNAGPTCAYSKQGFWLAGKTTGIVTKQWPYPWKQ